MKKLLTIIFLLSATQLRSQSLTWEWAKSATGDAEGYGIASDKYKYGDIYLTGSVGDSLGFENVTLYGQGAFIAKYNPAGDLLWAKSSVDPVQTFGIGVAIDTTGAVYLTGMFGGTILFDTISLTSAGAFDGFVAKYDQSGNLIWAKEFGGLQDEQCYGIATNALGNVFVTGFSSSPFLIIGTDTLLSSGDWEVFVVKFDAAGNIIWARNSVGVSPGINYANSVTSDNSDNAYITGGFTSSAIIFGNDTISNSSTLAGNGDVFLVKYDPIGNVIWVRGAQGVNADIGSSVTISSKDKLYLAGYFNSPTITFDSYSLNCSVIDDDVFLVEYDENGNVEWAKASSGTGNAQSYCVTTDTIGNAYVTGRIINGAITFDTITLQNPGGPDPMFVVRYNSSGDATFATALASGGDDRNGVAADFTGHVYVGGDFTTFGADPFVVGNDTLYVTGGGETPFLAKLSPKYADGISQLDSLRDLKLFPNPFEDILNIEVNDNKLSKITIYDLTLRKILESDFVNVLTIRGLKLSKGIYIYQVRAENGSFKKGVVIKQ